MRNESNAASIDALVSALGALVFATVRRLPQSERVSFANDLHFIGIAEASGGRSAAAAVIDELQRAATLACRK